MNNYASNDGKTLRNLRALWGETAMSQGEGADPEPLRHLSVLRDLLSRDYLSRADWYEALGDLARNVRAAVGAQEALVATWRLPEGPWEVVDSSGRVLRDQEIAQAASRSILEQVREKKAPLLVTGEEEIGIDSESIQAQQIVGFLAVPLFFWDVTRDQTERQFGGCLYVHRTLERAPFDALDVDIVSDIARIAEPTLNVLRYLKDVRMSLQASQEEVRQLRAATARQYRIGSDRVPFCVYEPLSRLMENNKVTMLLLGPTGSGKSHLARAYHYACPRKEKPFIVLDCGSVTSSETLSAELFGYAPSSGYANAPKGGSIGKARLAHEGTLFIDEVGNLSLDLQPRLLRLIQEGKLSPLGGSYEETVDIQIIAATNADLRQRIAEGRFREDLYHRLDVVHITVPGLSERADEIPEIAAGLLRLVAEEAGKELSGFADEAMSEIVAHSWEREGNIRGLENLIRRSVWAAPKGTTRLDAPHLRWLSEGEASARAPMAGHAGAASQRGQDLERVLEAIRTHRNATDAASALGLTYRQLYWKLQRAGLTVRDVLAGRT